MRRGLTILVAGADRDRWRSALALAAAQAASGGRARIHLDERAVPLIAAETALLDTALELGVAVSLCQSGLAEAGLDAATLDPRLHTGGLVGLLAALGDDRLAFA